MPNSTAGPKRSVIAMKNHTGPSQWEGPVGNSSMSYGEGHAQMMYHDKARVMGVLEISLLLLFIAVIAPALLMLL